jgi:hypothetical protein
VAVGSKVTVVAVLAVFSDGGVDDDEWRAMRNSGAWSTASIVSWNDGGVQTKCFGRRRTPAASGGLYSGPAVTKIDEEGRRFEANPTEGKWEGAGLGNLLGFELQSWQWHGSSGIAISC